MQEPTQKSQKNPDLNTTEEFRISKPPDKKRIFLSRVKRKFFKHVWLVRILLISGVLLGLLSLVFLVVFFISKTSWGTYLGLTRDFLFTPESKIKMSEDKTNFLILGKGGEGHEAPELTDTIMFVSVGHVNPVVNVISLPRDIWITDLRTKLNSVYYWGNKKEAGGGLILAKATVEEIIDVPVHYALVVDFSAFKKIVEVLEGIEVDVENSFIDEKYPIQGRENDLCSGDLEYKCRYETIKFDKGRQFMDGETALKFVRSRNAQGNEGTDLARAARQDKVVEAVKNKILSREILLSPKKLLELKKVMLDSIETDITPSAGAILARRAYHARNSLKTSVLPEEFLENPPKSPRYDNLYVFIPKEINEEDPTKRSFSKIQDWASCVLRNEQCDY